jgi:septal ring factor EnvC (AmiA/AmiB activator)
MSGPAKGGALARAIDMEIAKRKRRITQIAPKLKALQTEYKALREQLEELEELAKQWSDGMPEQTKAIADVPAKHESPVIDQRCEDVLDCLRERGPLGPLELADALRWNRSTLADPLRRLVERGDVIGEGSTRDRSYRLAQSNGNAVAA